MYLTEERLLFGHSVVKSRLAECCRVSGALTFFPDSSVLAPGRVVVVGNLFHKRIVVVTVLWGTFSETEMFFSLPQICAST